MSLLWLLVGVALGLLNTATQWWTVNRLHPDTPGRAVGLTIGGAALRWVLVVALLIVALRQGVQPTLLVFGGLWLGRWVLLGWIELEA